ncbi:hypothetical protein [Streptomyces sp. st77]|uniref:hypothetical protein n=1 Tax=Streptomyces sp. st77 TaxID=1828074 RepID=UPI00211D6734|nr:hypothetical protein [Streptomyces sp. st77]
MRRSAVCLGIGERAFRRDTRNTDYEAHQSATFLIGGGDIGIERQHQRGANPSPPPADGQREGELDATVPAQQIQRMVWSLYTGLHVTGRTRRTPRRG